MVLKRKLPDLDQDPFKSLYVQQAEVMIKFIRKYRRGEGDRAPSENELLERNKVSRTTIRQEFQDLESHGWVKRQRGKGTFVAVPKHRDYVQGFQRIEDRLKQLGLTCRSLLIDYRAVLPPES